MACPRKGHSSQNTTGIDLKKAEEAVSKGWPLFLRVELRGCAALTEVVEVFAGLEPHGFAGGDADFCPGARVPSDAGFAWADVEDSESAQLDAVAGGESLLQAFKDGFDGGFGFDAGQSGTLDYLMYDVLLNQWLSPETQT